MINMMLPYTSDDALLILLGMYYRTDYNLDESRLRPRGLYFVID